MGEQARHIWVVEDDPGIASQLVRGLRKAGFEVSLSTQDLDIRKCLRDEPDLIILDLMLPNDRSGLDILKELRDSSTIPVLILTARSDLEDRLKAFELGAQDYVTKPFFFEEVLARVKVRLNMAQTKDTLTFGDVTMDRGARELTRNGEPLPLTPYEYELLEYLVERAGRAISREVLSESLVRGQPNANARSVDSHVAKLRKKLGDAASKHIRTVRGLGYRFDVDKR